MSILGDIGLLFARQWIAGVDEADAIRAALKVNSKNEQVILNYLGENFSEKGQARRSVMIYLNLLRQMKINRIRGSISVKPSQLGILISDAEFYRNLSMIASHAYGLGFDVWIDAEEYEYVDRSLGVFLRALKRHKNIGMAVQCKLRRSMDDAMGIAAKGGMVRLVKGAYKEPAAASFEDDDSIRQNYIEVMKTLVSKRAKVMVATHDASIIEEAIELGKRRKQKIKFAMLMGIRSRLAQKLADGGNEVHIYAPFGEEWFDYSMRRIKEEGHAILLLRSIIQQ